MKNISLTKLSNLVKTNRDKLNITQKTLCDLTGINRAMISKIETGDYTPSIEQIEALGNALNFEYTDLFEEEVNETSKEINIQRHIQTESIYAGQSAEKSPAKTHVCQLSRYRIAKKNISARRPRPIVPK